MFPHSPITIPHPLEESQNDLNISLKLTLENESDQKSTPTIKKGK